MVDHIYSNEEILEATLDYLLQEVPGIKEITKPKSNSLLMMRLVNN